MIFLDGECYEIVKYSTLFDLAIYQFDDSENSSLSDDSITKCQSKCQDYSDCKGFSISLNNTCQLKQKMESSFALSSNSYLSAPKYCPLNGNWTGKNILLTLRNEMSSGNT